MANTYTPTYNLILPEVGSDTNAWGTHINADLTTIDSNMLSRSLTTAQTMAGALNLPSNGLNVGSGQLVVSSGNVSVSGQLGVTGAATFANTVTVAGIATLSNSLSVAGTASFANTVNVTGAVTLATNGLNVGSGQLSCTGGNVSMSGSLAVTGTISGTVAATNLTASGSTTLSGTLAVTGASTLTGNVTIQSGTSERTVALGSSGGYFFGNATTVGWKDNSANQRIYWDGSGNFTAAGNVTAYSDARLKESVTTIEDAMSYVRRMRGVWYRLKEIDKAGTGVIAQEVQPVIPELVHENDGMLSVAYGNFAGVFIEALKQLEERIAKLEAAE